MKAGFIIKLPLLLVHCFCILKTSAPRKPLLSKKEGVQLTLIFFKMDFFEKELTLILSRCTILHLCKSYSYFWYLSFLQTPAYKSFKWDTVTFQPDTTWLDQIFPLLLQRKSCGFIEMKSALTTRKQFLDKIAHFLVRLSLFCRTLFIPQVVRCCSLVISQTFLIFDYQILNVSIRLT